MRFTNYSRYRGTNADALNLEALLEHLSDFLLQSGFAGGSYYHPFWGEFEDGDRSLDSLRQALLRALITTEVTGRDAANQVARHKAAGFPVAANQVALRALRAPRPSTTSRWGPPPFRRRRSTTSPP